MFEKIKLMLNNPIFYLIIFVIVLIVIVYLYSIDSIRDYVYPIMYSILHPFILIFIFVEKLAGSAKVLLLFMLSNISNKLNNLGYLIILMISVVVYIAIKFISYRLFRVRYKEDRDNINMYCYEYYRKVYDDNVSNTYYKQLTSYIDFCSELMYEDKTQSNSVVRKTMLPVRKDFNFERFCDLYSYDNMMFRSKITLIPNNNNSFKLENLTKIDYCYLKGLMIIMSKPWSAESKREINAVNIAKSFFPVFLLRKSFDFYEVEITLTEN